MANAFLRALDRAIRMQNDRALRRTFGPGGPPLICSDCRTAISEGAKSAPTIQKVFCDPCYRFRAAHMWEFDPRTKDQLEAAARQEVA